tara:strand:+ start:3716 stop:4117 length:402 start_codon:yes stop_codon:yes gene_type:complete
MEPIAMTKLKTTRKTYVFSAPFNLTGFDQSFPAGQYNVEIEEQMMEGMSFVAFKRIATTMRMIHAADGRAKPGLVNNTFNIDPRDFELAILKDRHQCSEEISSLQSSHALSNFDQLAIDASENEGMTDHDYHS